MKPKPNWFGLFYLKEIDMKVNFERMFFYSILILVSACVGYAIKPEPIVEKNNSTQIRECVQAIHMMEAVSTKNYYYSVKKTPKQLAIERMMRN